MTYSGEPRRDPQEFLRRAKEEEARRSRGTLKVFFGAAAGVGKTYAMLEAAREQRCSSPRARRPWRRCFADRGPGLPADILDRVFEKFYRAKPETAGGGAGLGLTICRAIVSAHGGQIWAENRPGGGLVFHFTLPLSEGPPGPAKDRR